MAALKQAEKNKRYAQSSFSRLLNSLLGKSEQCRVCLLVDNATGAKCLLEECENGFVQLQERQKKLVECIDILKNLVTDNDEQVDSLEEKREETNDQVQELRRSIDASIGSHKEVLKKLEKGVQKQVTEPEQKVNNEGIISKSFNIGKLRAIDDELDYRGWRNWTRAWQNNAQCYALEKYPRSIQVHSLLTAGGPRVDKLVRTELKLDPEEDTCTVELIIEGLTRYFREKRSIVCDYMSLFSRTQRDNESFESFRMSLEEHADDADLQTLSRENLLTILIIKGLKDTEAKQKLLELLELPTLEETLGTAKAYEIARINRQGIDTGSTVNKISSYKRGRSQSRGRQPPPGKPVQPLAKHFPPSRPQHNNPQAFKQGKACTRCSYTHPNRPCPAMGKTCTKCKKGNHFAQCCKSNNKGQSNLKRD